MTNNPYNIASPVVGAQFFGQAELISSVVHTLNSTSQNAVMIFGLPRFGKTSFLQEVANQFSNQAYVPVYFGLKDKIGLSQEQILQSLARTIAEKTKIPESSQQTPLDVNDFHTNFLPKVLAQIAPQRLVLLIDDIDLINKSNTETNGVVSHLQDLIVKEPSITFILTTGTSPENLPVATQKISELAKSETLLPLTPQEIQSLITEISNNSPIRPSSEAIEAITRLSAGHPYFAQLIAHEAFEQALNNNASHLDIDAVNTAFPHILEKSDPAIAPLVAGLSERELKMLATCAEIASKSKFTTPKLISSTLRKYRITIEDRELNGILEELEQRGLIIREMHGVFTFFAPLAAHWVLKESPLKAKQTGLPASNKWSLVTGLAFFFIAVGIAFFLWSRSFSQEVSSVASPSLVPTIDSNSEAISESIEEPTQEPTSDQSIEPTSEPTQTPTEIPTQKPTTTSTTEPTQEPSPPPTETPTEEPETPTPEPTVTPTQETTETSVQSPTPAPAAVALPAGLQFLDLEVAGGGQPPLIYAVAKDTGIYQRTPNGGWSLFSTDLGDGIKVRTLGVRPESTQNITVYVGYPDGARRWNTTDGWSGKSSLPRFHDFVAIPNSNIVFAGSDIGIYRSLDDGRSWEAVNLRLNGRIIEVAVFSLSAGLDWSGNWTLYAVGADTAVMFKTTVNPAQEGSISATEPRWEDITCQCEANTALFAIATDPTNAQIIYVGNDRSRISFSQDGGRTWSAEVVPVGQAQEVFITNIAVAPGNGAAYATTGSDLAAYASNGLLIRDDQNQWSAVKPPGFIPGQDYIPSLAIDPDNPQIVYVGGSNGLFKFDSNSRAWIESP